MAAEATTTVMCSCILSGGGGASGVVTISQPVSGSSISGVNLNVEVSGLSEGDYTVAVHEYGDQRRGCASMGNIFNPKAVPDESAAAVPSRGAVSTALSSDSVTLIGPESIIGRAIVVANGTERVAGGVIGIAQEQS